MGQVWSPICDPLFGGDPCKNCCVACRGDECRACCEPLGEALQKKIKTYKDCLETPLQKCKCTSEGNCSRCCGIAMKSSFLWVWTPIDELEKLIVGLFPNTVNVFATAVHILALGWQYQYWLIVVIAVAYGYSLKAVDSINFGKWDVFEDFMNGLSSDHAIGVIEGLLTFIIPLSLNSALNRNKTGINAFNAFTGEIVALAWQVLNMSKDFGYLGTLKAGTVPMKYKRILDILTVLPEAAKHEQRGDSDIQKLYLNNLTNIDDRYIIDKRERNEEEGYEKCCGDCVRLFDCRLIFVEDDAGDDRRIKFVELPWAQKFFPQELYPALQQNKMYELTKTTPLTQRLMATAMGEITKIRNDKDNETANHLMQKWQSLYSEYGTMGNMMAYKKPQMFENVLYLALVLFVIALNINLRKHSLSKSWGVSGFTEAAGAVPSYAETPAGGFNPWIGVFSVYFMILLKCVSRQIGNPFLAQRRGFLTVTESSRNATQQLEEIRYLVENKRQNAFTTVREKRHILGRESVSTAGTVLSMTEDAPIPRIKY